MGLLYPAQEKYFKGPWLIGEKELAELDLYLAAIETSINNAKAKIIQEAEENDVSILDDEVTSTIRIKDKDGKVLKSNSIREILKDPVLENMRPNEIDIDISYNSSNFFQLSISNDSEDGSIYYNIECDDRREILNINHNINEWIKKHKPKRVFYYWHEAYPLIALIAFIAALGFWDSYYEETKPTAKEFYKNEIKEIIKVGINDSNRDNAILLNFKLGTNYIPEGTKPTITYNKPMFRFMIYSIVLFVIAILRPLTIIGLGKNQKWYSLYSWYPRFVIFGIGGVLIIDPIVNAIHKFLSI